MAIIEFLDLSGLKENTADSILTNSFSGPGGLVSATPGTLTYLTGTPDGYYYYYGSNDIEDYYTITLDGAFAFGALATVSGSVSSIGLFHKGVELLRISDVSGDAALMHASLSSDVSLLAFVLGGNDTITGPDISMTLYGASGDDVIVGGAEADSLDGGTGNDTLSGGGDGDNIRGKKGNDTLLGDAGGDFLYGGGGRDVLRGGTGSDTLNGGAGRDELIGSIGRDSLNGGNGADDLYGGKGRDNLSGGEGDDNLYGGEGRDRFLFRDFEGGRGDTGHDTIHDWEVGEDIVLSRYARKSSPDLEQVGDDVVISGSVNSITVLNAQLDDVQDSLQLQSYYYYYY